MCGIFGYIGHKEASPILLNGLQMLEYRGYDSAGLAILNGTIKLVKTTGNVKSLTNKVAGMQVSRSEQVAGAGQFSAYFCRIFEEADCHIVFAAQHHNNTNFNPCLVIIAVERQGLDPAPDGFADVACH